jgi:hypothetical protein
VSTGEIGFGCSGTADLEEQGSESLRGRKDGGRRLQLINGILNYLSLIKYAAGALFLENNRRSNTDIIDIAGSNRSQSQMAER